jgi:dolichol-phosphate mannosyltransferase
MLEHMLHHHRIDAVRRPGPGKTFQIDDEIRRGGSLAIDMLASTSMALMRLISVAGVVVGALGLIYGAVTVVRALLGQGPDTGTGWASLMVVVSVIGGLALLGIGLIGEYLWRVLEEVRGRPVHLERARGESA